jgi:serine/threonine-protein kinase
VKESKEVHKLDDRLAAFTDKYFESGAEEIPASWPEEARQDCLLFLRLMKGDLSQDEDRILTRSVLSDLREEHKGSDIPTLDLPDPAGAPPRARDKGDERYIIEEELGRGGMGRVLLAYDRDFRRRIAMKVLLHPHPNGTSRFLEEAQATAQLEHPNIDPVYDLGSNSEGSPFFTMKWIRGRNLEEILTEDPERPTLVRLVQILQQAAMGIDFAHSRAVIHRDLKPQNIMVGDYGEVLVVDWGLAKILGKTREETESVSTTRAEDGVLTIDGSIQGSLPYMAPEQAQGRIAEIDARTDVFGLGAILYRILVGAPPYEEKSVEAQLRAARRGDIRPPRERSPGHTIPANLEGICLRALAPQPNDRFQSAREFQDALQRYIEGIHDAERRAAETERLLRTAESVHEELRGIEERKEELAVEEKELRSHIADHESPENKAPLWRAVEKLGAATNHADRLFNRTTAAYNAVLSVDPENHAARRALAKIYHARLERATARGDTQARTLFEGLVEQYDDGRFIELLRGEKVWSLDTTPPGAVVLLSRYEERGLLLVESPQESPGATPLRKRLPAGSYLARVKLPGYHELHYPFVVDSHAGSAVRLQLYPEGSIPEGFVQVPAGESIVGGKPELFASLARSRPFVPEFFITRFPITLEQYCEFLTDHFAGMPGTLEQKQEAMQPLLPSRRDQHYTTLQGDGQFRPRPPVAPQHPVTAVGYKAAWEFCRWYGAKVGHKVRLPTEVEWERSGRGADGRLFPWGNHFDWAFCKGALSRQGEPGMEPVGAFAADSSPFGVRDLAGGVREMCDGAWGEGYRPCRGASWYNPFPVAFRLDVQMMFKEATGQADLGLRVAYSPR